MNELELPLLSGSIPPQFGVPSNLNLEKMLLFTGWIYGLTTNVTVHRLALFSFVQSHIANKSDETLQQVIENSDFWKSEKRGIYRLSLKGQQKIVNDFGNLKASGKVGYEFSFYTKYEGNEFKIKVDVDSARPRLLPFVNNQEKRGPEAIKFLEGLGGSVPPTQSSLPKKLLNWILGRDDYRWTAKYREFANGIASNRPMESIVTVLEPLTPTLELQKSPPVQEVIQSSELVTPILENLQEIFVQEEEDELSFPEGKEIYRLHRTKERSKTVVELAKRRLLNLDKNLRCEICSFSFYERYGEIGQGFIEAHHIKPLSELTQETETQINDIALVCSNCHRILHRKRPWLTPLELREILGIQNLYEYEKNHQANNSNAADG